MIIVILISLTCGYLYGLHLPIYTHFAAAVALIALYNFGNFRWWEGLSAIPYILFAVWFVIGMVAGNLMFYFSSNTDFSILRVFVPQVSSQ